MGQKAILLVEDEVMIGEGVRGLLQDAGYEVFGPCMSISEADHVIDLFRLDGAILDIELLDGAIDPITKRLAADGIPFCVISGYKRPEVAVRALPFVDWLEKPFHEADLLQAVERMLSRESGSVRAML